MTKPLSKMSRSELVDACIKEQQRSAALAAYVELLTKELKRCMSFLHCHFPSSDKDAAYDEAKKCLGAAPTASLARLKAEWQAEALERAIRIMGQQIPEGAWVCFSEDLQAMVNELRRQAEEEA